MKKRVLFLVICLILGCFQSVGQDRIQLKENAGWFGKSISNQFTIYEVDSVGITPDHFLDKKSVFGRLPLYCNQSMANLDFTCKSYFIHFTLENTSSREMRLLLETARPVTNSVEMLCVNTGEVWRSGDGISFQDKSIASNRSILPLSLGGKESKEYVLKFMSDGESLTIPMIFKSRSTFEKQENSQQLLSGVFFGIFLFVLIIYFTFYMLLRETLFLWYVLYVFFSGLLQFALDGYLHMYLIPSGGYWTHHSIILIAGAAVLCALIYAMNYLVLKGWKRLVSRGMIGLIVITQLMSLFPGELYELSFVFINGLSFVVMLYLLIVAILKRKDKNVSRMFILGLFLLVLGGVVFVMGNSGLIDFPRVTQSSLKLGTLLEIICLSILMARRYKQLQEEKEQAQKRLVDELAEKNELMSQVNDRLEFEVSERTKQIENQRQLLVEKNEDFVASVKYAKRIQQALLSDRDQFEYLLPESLMFFKPKDIVSGDFFWIETVKPMEAETDGLIIYATADCTGHGVPGAFVSIVANNFLRLAKRKREVTEPGEMLDYVDRGIRDSLNSKRRKEQIHDGMDVAICAIDPKYKELRFAGARNSAYIVRKGKLIELKGDRKSIGFETEEQKTFTTQRIALKSGDVIYTCSDGFADQFGGKRMKKFMIKRLKQLFVDIAELPLSEQERIIEETFFDWKGDLEQLDDVLVIGVRVP